MLSMEKPLVSIIMPAYNAEQVIASAIRSVQAQTIREWELLVIDDCSQDKTAEIVAQIAKDDSRILLYSNEKNLRVAKSRNKGLSRCRGKYIAFLDSDDKWQPDKLEKQIECMEKTGADLVYTSYSIVNQAGDRQCRNYVVPATVSYEHLLKENIIGCSTVLLNSACAENIWFEESVFHEDYALWLKLLRSGCKAVGVTDVLVEYFYHLDSKAGNKWNAAKHRWDIYHRYLKLPLWSCVWYFLQYVIGGLRKYRKV